MADGDDISLDYIDAIRDWGPRMSNTQAVPSLMGYPPQNGQCERGWGKDISATAIVIQNARLGLQTLSGTGSEEEDPKEKRLREALRYIGRSAEQVVTDYLRRVFYCLQKTRKRYSDKIPSLSILSSLFQKYSILSFLRSLFSF
jgi:hypothetical protein